VFIAVTCLFLGYQRNCSLSGLYRNGNLHATQDFDGKKSGHQLFETEMARTVPSDARVVLLKQLWLSCGCLKVLVEYHSS
jgi:hypothetical protein